MKTFIASCIAAFGLSFAVSVLVQGCSSNSVQTAVAAEGVTIPSVNAAMTAWSQYVASGKATAQQITTVSNAYAAYYQSQLMASNAASIYVANPSTNFAGVLVNLEATALASETNVVNLIKAFSP